MSTTGSSDETGHSRLGMYLRTHTNPPVFLISAGVIAAFLLAGVLFTVVLLLICAGLVRAMRQEPPPALLVGHVRTGANMADAAQPGTAGTRRGDDRGPAAEHEVPVR